MSELRKLADDVERLFKDVCKRFGDQVDTEFQFRDEHKDLGRAKRLMGQALEVLSRLAAEQEALSPALQEHKPGDITWVEDVVMPMPPKGSSVEYYKDRLAGIAAQEWDDNKTLPVKLCNAINDYKRALSASPDPEGEWQWVPSGYVIVPEEPTKGMLDVLGMLASPKRAYQRVLGFCPPVPKKGERA